MAKQILLLPVFRIMHSGIAVQKMLYREKPLTEETIAAAVNAAINGMNVLGDHFASEEYRKHLAKVYLKKALKLLS